MRQQARFQDLLGRLLDEVCSPEERDELALLCQQSPDCLRQLQEALELDQMIAQNVVANRCEEAFAEDVSLALTNQKLPDFDELASRFLDSSLRPHEARRLHGMCLRDPERANQLRESLEFTELISQALVESSNDDAFVDGLVTRMWAETASDQFVDDFASKIIAIDAFQNAGAGAGAKFALEGSVGSGEAKGSARHSAYPAHGWGRTVGFAAAAAVAAALIVVALLRGPGRDDDSARAIALGGGGVAGVAIITEASTDVRWSGASEQAIGANGEVGVGRYQLAAGAVRVRFSSGAEMTVEGPAEFEVRSDHEAFVHSGLAMARAEKPGDLQVQSNGFELVDVEHTLAVDARFDSFTEAVFFDGAGQLRLASQTGGGAVDQAGANTRNLYAFETVRADHERERLVDVPYNPSVFSRTWQLISGVESKSASVKIELPGAVLIPDVHAADKVQVFLEKDGFVAADGVMVDLLTPGKFTSLVDADSDANVGVAIQPQGELRSYLLQRWAPQRDGKTLQASVTFADPVVGVMFSADRLVDSDAMVGADLQALTEAFGPGQERGLDRRSGEDQILLSDDGRTLSLVLHGGGDDVLDHIRVLVERQ